MSTAIIVHTKDSNRWYTERCVNILFKKLPVQITKNTYILTEYEPYRFMNETNIITGAGSWSDRLIKALDLITTENVIILSDDTIIKRCNESTLLTIIDMHDRKKADATKLGDRKNFIVEPTGMTLGPLLIKKQVDGLFMSHTPLTIFNRKWLLASLKPNQTIWEHECEGTNMITGTNHLIFVVCDNDSNRITETPGGDIGCIIEYHDALVDGKDIEYVGKWK